MKNLNNIPTCILWFLGPFLRPSYLKHVKIKCLHNLFSPQTVVETPNNRIFYSRMRRFPDILKQILNIDGFTVCPEQLSVKDLSVYFYWIFQICSPHSNSRNTMTHSTSLRRHWLKSLCKSPHFSQVVLPAVFKCCLIFNEFDTMRFVSPHLRKLLGFKLVWGLSVFSLCLPASSYLITVHFIISVVFQKLFVF